MGRTGASTINAWQRRAILEDTKSRLMWTRVDELEALLLNLQDLSVAVLRVEHIRQTMQASVESDLAEARRITTQYMPRSVHVHYDSSFTRLFSTLMGYFSREDV